MPYRARFRVRDLSACGFRAHDFCARWEPQRAHLCACAHGSAPRGHLIEPRFPSFRPVMACTYPRLRRWSVTARPPRAHSKMPPSRPRR